MKKYIIPLIIAFPLLFAACDVDVVNPNTTSTDTFWKTEDDALEGVNAIYNMFYKPGTFTRWIWFRLDLTSDEGFSSSPWAELKEWTQFNYRNYNFWEGNAWTYTDFYKAIFRANQVLLHVPGIEFEDNTYKRQLLGQAYYLRGFYYYYLALLWGSENKSLSILLEPKSPGFQPKGHTKEEVYNQAIADLTLAQDMLPNSWDAKNTGRATKGAALAYRAKSYMQLHNYEEAKKDLHWIVEGEGMQLYDLVPNYADNFTQAGENNMESIFEIQYSDVHPAPAGDGDFDINPNLGQNRGQFFAPPGIGWTDGEIRPWLIEEFKKERDIDGNYDIRLKYSAFYEDMHHDFENNDKVYSLTSNDELWSNWRGRVFFRKYSNEPKGSDDYHNPINIRLVRLADVLLLYAECIVKTGGNLADAVKLVDRVRSRANMNPLETNHPTAATSADAFLKRLQMERALELATEGHRWGDIKRWGLTESQEGLNELISRDPDFNNFVLGKHDCMPIQSVEVDNNPNLEQNPKY